MTQNSEKTRFASSPLQASEETEPVNLYRLLQISSDADERELQRRISQYYLEAQQNLDHRNAKKRLHFQQMYEIYLPQARHVLLDPQRRAEYDRFLHTQQAHSSTHQDTVHKVVAQPVAQEQAISQDLATERMMLWQQWQNDLTTALAESEGKHAAHESQATFEAKETDSQSAPRTGSSQSHQVVSSQSETKRSQPKRSWSVENVTSNPPIAPVSPVTAANQKSTHSSRIKLGHLVAISAVTLSLLGVLIFRRSKTSQSEDSGTTAQPFRGVPTVVPGIIQAEDYDEGGEGVAYSDASTQNQGGGYRQGAVGIGAIASGEYFVGWTQKGEWIQYSVEASQAGKYRLDVRLMTRGPGRISVEVDGSNVVSGFLVPDTGGFWQSVFVGEFEMTKRRHAVRLLLDEDGVNFDLLRFSFVS